MTHADFVSGHRRGTLRVVVDPQRAARFLSARLLLPFLMLPVVGAGIALALVGKVWIGLAIMALGIVAPRLIKRSAPRFLLAQALEDEKVYQELTQAGVFDIQA
jgi:pilus assembly protein TadC